MYVKFLRFQKQSITFGNIIIFLIICFLMTDETYSASNLSSKDKPLVTKKKEVKPEKINDVPKRVPNAPEGWMYGLIEDGELDSPFFDGWLGNQVEHKKDIRWSEGSEPVRKGNKSIRFNIGRGEDRCPEWACKRGSDLVLLDDHTAKRTNELYDTLDQIQGEDFWYFFSIYIPNDFPDPFNEKTTYIDWNSDWNWTRKAFLEGYFSLLGISPVTNDCLPGVDNISIAEAFLEKGYLHLGYFNWHGNSKKIMKIDDMRNKWTDILIHINYDLEDGSIAFWVNGEFSHEKNIAKGAYDQNRIWDGSEIFEPDKRFFETNEDFWNYGDSSIDECDYLVVTRFGGDRIGINLKDNEEIAKNFSASVLYYDEVRIGSTREEVDIVSFPELPALN